jgi:hypothetical protein
LETSPFFVQLVKGAFVVLEKNDERRVDRKKLDQLKRSFRLKCEFVSLLIASNPHRVLTAVVDFRQSLWTLIINPDSRK